MLSGVPFQKRKFQKVSERAQIALKLQEEYQESSEEASSKVQVSSSRTRSGRSGSQVQVQGQVPQKVPEKLGQAVERQGESSRDRGCQAQEPWSAVKSLRSPSLAVTVCSQPECLGERLTMPIENVEPFSEDITQQEVISQQDESSESGLEQLSTEESEDLDQVSERADIALKPGGKQEGVLQSLELKLPQDPQASSGFLKLPQASSSFLKLPQASSSSSGEQELQLHQGRPEFELH
jgi:hypothetical protein